MPRPSGGGGVGYQREPILERVGRLAVISWQAKETVVALGGSTSTPKQPAGGDRPLRPDLQVYQNPHIAGLFYSRIRAT